MLICLSVFTNVVYPAALTAFGGIGNAYILGGQIKDLGEDLGGQIREMDRDFNEVKNEIKSLRARLTDMKIHDMSVSE